MQKWIITGTMSSFGASASTIFLLEKDHLSFRLFHYIRSILISHFLPLWTLSLVLIAVCGFFLSAHGDSKSSALTRQDVSLHRPSFLRQLGLIDGIAAVLLLLFVVLYVFQVFYKEDFAYYDDEMLTDFSVLGKSFAPPIWPSVGRFFPLADQEFNLLRFVTRSPAGYHSFVAVELLVLVVLLLVLLRCFKFHYRVLILIAVMLAPSFVIPFSGFVYPERNVLFWLAIILLCLQNYSESKKRIYFVGCLVAAQFALYYKETVVVFVVAYAATQLLLEALAARRAAHFSWGEIARNNSLQLTMLALSAIYAVVFLAVMLPNRSFSYITGVPISLGLVLSSYLKINWLLPILLAVLLFRLWRFLHSHGQIDPMWDSLAVGAVAYSACIVALKLFSGYYMAPANFVALIYLARVSLAWQPKPTKVRMAVLATVFLAVLIHDAVYSSFRIVERKSTIAAKSELAGFLSGYLPTVNSSSVELYFPYADGFRLMELSAYLKYKGFHLAEQSVTAPVADPRLVIEGREAFTNNRCVNYREYACIYEGNAKAGALIVVLPDDTASMNDVADIGKDSTLLLARKAPGICSRKWFRLFHAASPMFSMGQLPEHWLQLHIFKKPS
jgi:hypothetical protein